MARLFVISTVLLMLLTAGHLYASLHAEYSPCSGIQGKVIEVKDNEVFTISVCEKVKVFREFSYCYDVEAGDSVFFDGDPTRCEVTGFTVIRNGVQCGVMCPESNYPVKADKQ
jgi:hypothetical protein